MIQAGHTVVEVARWVGHLPQVCLGTYAHLFDTVTERIDADREIRRARYGTGADEEQATGSTVCIRCAQTSGWYDHRPPGTDARKSRFAGSLKVRALLAQLVEHFHGKEGVGGSSPPEGLVGFAGASRST
jgi:hypothetical protein